jgi:hypothetical protein
MWQKNDMGTMVAGQGLLVDNADWDLPIIDFLFAF